MYIWEEETGNKFFAPALNVFSVSCSLFKLPSSLSQTVVCLEVLSSSCKERKESRDLCHILSFSCFCLCFVAGKTQELVSLVTTKKRTQQ